MLSKIADAEGIDVPDADVEAEVELARERYQATRRPSRYFESERGRDFIRSTLRRTQVVETLVDRWLAAHPTIPPCRTSRTTRRRRVDGARGRGRRLDRRHRPGLIPGADRRHAAADQAPTKP